LTTSLLQVIVEVTQGPLPQGELLKKSGLDRAVLRRSLREEMKEAKKEAISKERAV
jgi:hypothetical protein